MYAKLRPAASENDQKTTTGARGGLSQGKRRSRDLSHPGRSAVSFFCNDRTHNSRLPAKDPVPHMNNYAETPALLLVPRRREQEPSRAVQRELVDAMIELEPGGMTWRRTFAGAPDQIPQARHFTRYLLADDPCQDDAELIISELAANALKHTSSGLPRGTFIAEITRTTSAVTLAVYDCGWGGVPRLGLPHRIGAEEGRGLALVSAIADSVGYEGDEEVGHKVWATIQTRSGA
ncbi:ATP-binding protein [Nonomuraea sp. 10N515B]|uniref:ATP-binding protein n=1 Tax=Nonomuraea sp. 10N515B TaxID=3457422 RepID=UPI003FCE854F